MKKLVPFVIAALGLWLLAGCFYVPSREVTESTQSYAPEFHRLLGAAGSGRKLRVGSATRSELLALFGKPNEERGNELSYLWTSHEGYWVYPLCFSKYPAEAHRYRLSLMFDDDNVLQRFELWIASGPAIGYDVTVPYRKDSPVKSETIIEEGGRLPATRP